jgi:hypothetical protein
VQELKETENGPPLGLMLADGDAKVTLPSVTFTVTIPGALEGGVPVVAVGIPNDKLAGETVI